MSYPQDSHMVQSGPQRSRLRDIRRDIEVMSCKAVFRPQFADRWAVSVPAVYMDRAMHMIDEVLKRDRLAEASNVIGAWHARGLGGAAKYLVYLWAEKEKEPVNLALFDKKQP